jgi:hypothetical protein
MFSNFFTSFSRPTSSRRTIELYFNAGPLLDSPLQVFLELSFDENVEKSSTTEKMAEKANVKKSKRVEKKEKKEKKRELAKQLRKEVRVVWLFSQI